MTVILTELLVELISLFQFQVFLDTDPPHDVEK